MEATETPAPGTTRVTVDVPEDRVAQFYAWFGRFLAWSEGRGRRRGRHGRHHRCHHRGEGDEVQETGSTPEAVV
jgi:hypothetical protein